MDPVLQRKVRANLFPFARQAIGQWNRFHWHPTADKCDTYKLQSSQALAIDLFGTIKMSPDRDYILDRWAESMGLPAGGPWDVHLEWMDPKNHLNERKLTQVDAIARGQRVVIFFECKFTEQNAGECSQVRRLSKGAHSGVVQCSGKYEPQKNPANEVESHCALSGKGINYWNYIPQVFDYDANKIYECPFAGPGFQWMRNLVLCWKIAQEWKLAPAFVIVYADAAGLSIAEKAKQQTWGDWQKHLREEAVSIRACSFQMLTQVAERATRTDRLTFQALRGWIEQKIEKVAGSLPSGLGTSSKRIDCGAKWPVMPREDDIDLTLEVALIGLRRSFMTLEAYEKAVTDGIIVKKPKICSDDADFAEKHPLHPLNGPHRFSRMAAADRIRDLARERRKAFPAAVLDNLHVALFDCCAAVRASVAEALQCAGSDASVLPLRRLVECEEKSKLVRDNVQAALERLQAK